jgi:hypothetical protein
LLQRLIGADDEDNLPGELDEHRRLVREQQRRRVDHHDRA